MYLNVIFFYFFRFFDFGIGHQGGFYVLFFIFFLSLALMLPLLRFYIACYERIYALFFFWHLACDCCASLFLGGEQTCALSSWLCGWLSNKISMNFLVKAAALVALVCFTLFFGFRGGEIVGRAISSVKAPPPMPASSSSILIDDDDDGEEGGNGGEDELGVSRSERERLTAFYKKHNPSRLGDVDVILSRYN